jgi:hypothetical protein
VSLGWHTKRNVLKVEELQLNEHCSVSTAKKIEKLLKKTRKWTTYVELVESTTAVQANDDTVTPVKSLFRLYLTAEQKLSRLRSQGYDVQLNVDELYDIMLSQKEGERTKLNKSQVITKSSFKNVNAKLSKQQKVEQKQRQKVQNAIKAMPSFSSLPFDQLYACYLNTPPPKQVVPYLIDTNAAIAVENITFKSLTLFVKTRRLYKLADQIILKLKKRYKNVQVTRMELTLNLYHNHYVTPSNGVRRWHVIDDTKPITLNNLSIDYAIRRKIDRSKHQEDARVV